MSSDTSVSSIPVAWLRPFPEGYTLPLWRWILLPASAFMLRRNKGVWVSGTLRLTEDDLRFEQSKGISRAQPASWAIPLNDIKAVNVTKGIASDTLELEHPNGSSVRIMTVRADAFIAALRAAVER